MRYMHLRLTQKPADKLHDLDLSRARIGDIIVVTPYSASKLIAEGWAVEAPSSRLPADRNIYPPSRAAAS